MPAVLQHHRLRRRQRLPHVALEAGRDQPVPLAPDEEGRPAQLPEALVEPALAPWLVAAELPRRGGEGDPGARAAPAAEELIRQGVLPPGPPPPRARRPR